MTNELIAKYWVEKAYEDLDSADDNFAAGRYQNAVRDTYFACFHVFSSLLFKAGRTFKKHKEVRAALHRDYIRKKILPVSWGKHYDWLFDNRHKADYRPLVKFETEQVKDIIEQSKTFVKIIERM